MFINYNILTPTILSQLNDALLLSDINIIIIKQL
jgi:hypothetical protein